MNLARLSYRATQFRKFLLPRPSPTGLAQARRILTPAQWQLFTRLHPAEQSHSLEVMHKLLAQGDSNPDLLVAALLHDIGKIHFPLHLLERVWIVIVKAFAPRLALRWARSSFGDQAPRWQRVFLVAQQHPAWGAELALAADVSPLSASLIHRHQETTPCGVGLEETLLRKLQAVDDHN